MMTALYKKKTQHTACKQATRRSAATGEARGGDGVRLVLDGMTPKSAEPLHQSLHIILDRIVGGAAAPGAM
jgi:hypothetical protein